MASESMATTLSHDIHAGPSLNQTLSERYRKPTTLPLARAAEPRPNRRDKLPKQPESVPRCLNCARPVDLLYCSNCGQSLRQIRVSISTLTIDFLGDVFTYDAKVFRSMVPLFFRPGFLTLEFIKGRRVRYIPPLRMYLFFSLLFFLAINLTRDSTPIPDNRPPGARALMLVAADENLADDIRTTNAAFVAQILETHAYAEFNAAREQHGLDPLTPGAEIDTVANSQDNTDTAAQFQIYATALAIFRARLKEVEELRAGSFELSNGIHPTGSEFGDDTAWGRWANQYVARQAQRLNRMAPNEFGKMLRDTFLKLLPNVMFLLLPLFAFYLKLVYVRRDPLYIDHLIAAFHFHAFVFGCASLLTPVLVAIDEMRVNVVGLLGAMLLIQVYLYFMLKRIYGQSHLKTSLKFVLLSLAYFPTLFTAMIMAVLVSVFIL